MPTDLAAQRDRTILMSGLFAGLRTGELHRLCWRNVHVDAGMLETIGKGAKPATVIATPQRRTELEGWHATTRVMPDFHPTWPVLPILEAPCGDTRDITVRGPIKALSIEGIRRVVNRHGNAIGITYLRPHDLRRTLAGILDARHLSGEDTRPSCLTGCTAVLAAIYLIFTEGHTATAGPSLGRNDLSREAIRFGRVLVEFMPDEPEAVGLLALMLLTAARRPARTHTDGSLVRLADQDRALWDRTLIDEGHDLVRACLRRNQPGPFQIQAAIAAVHADAPTAAATDWSQIVALYDQLYAMRPNAVVALNRAIAIGERDGAAAGLDALAQLDAAALDAYQPYHAARADLLARAGRKADARAAYDRAIELSTNPTERSFLERQRGIVAPS